MALRTGILGLAVFVAACGGLQPDQAPQMGLPGWDGTQIVCNEEVSFAPEADAVLPVFEADERLGLCARSMRYIELHREFGDRTSYFGVAAISTASLAATYAPMVRRAYSEGTWAFLADLSRVLETGVNAAAAKAGQGGVFRARLDTAALLRDEQALVQSRLDEMAMDDPEAYAQLIEEINGTLNPTNRLLIAAINRNPFFRAYEGGLAQIRARRDGQIDYADMEQRIEVSEVLQALIEGISPGEPAESR